MISFILSKLFPASVSEEQLVDSSIGIFMISQCLIYFANSDPFKSQGEIVLKLNKFKEFADERAGKRQIYSEPVFIQGLPWKIKVYTNMESRKCLCFYVQCDVQDKGLCISVL